jgi:hypothetical protein
LTTAPLSPSPVLCPKIDFGSSGLSGIVNAQAGANKAAAGRSGVPRCFSLLSPGRRVANPPQLRNFSVTSALQIHAAPVDCCRLQGIQMKTIKVKTARLPAGLPVKFYFAVAAIALALLAIPQFGHAQGIIGGAQEGAREGGRAAGPVGAVVGGAVGAGVGGAVGAVDGVLGIPNHRYYRHHYHCRGFYDRYGRYRCYR